MHKTKKKPLKKVLSHKVMQPILPFSQPSILILLLVLSIGVIGTLTLRFARPSLFPLFHKSPTNLPLPAKLSLVVDRPVIQIGTTLSATIILDSPNQPVQAGDFIVTFDPSYLTVLDVLPGSYFRSYPIKKWERSSVQLSGVALLSRTTVKTPIGKGNVGTIIFKAVTPILKTNISFDSARTIATSNGKNILGDISGASLTIKPPN